MTLKNMTNYIELLAPAGNLEKLNTAFAFGADAVYLGLPDFSLRVRINAFDHESIQEAIKIAHAQGKKVYVTINIFAHNEHIAKLPEYLKFLQPLDVDALIASDPGIIAMIKAALPDTDIHLSTQANCTNWQTVKFWQDQGLKRIILGRETKLEDIKEMHEKCPNMELEYFVHGAMCMSYSGRCFLSKHFNDRSANLGDCTQPCRWKYRITEVLDDSRQLDVEQDEHGSYLMNSKDLCLIKHLSELADAGVSSFKIEGRAKSVYYLATVINAYRQAIDSLQNKKSAISIDELYNDLNTRLMHRGYTTGFLLGAAEQNTTNSHSNCLWEFCGQVIASEQQTNGYLIQVKVHNTLKIGEQLEVVRPLGTIFKLTLSAMNDENGQALEVAHGGGGGNVVSFISPENLPALSVLRRQK